MAYDPAEKFVQPLDGIIVVGESATNAEIEEAQARIRQGESAEAVWAEIDRRVAERERTMYKGPVRSA